MKSEQLLVSPKRRLKGFNHVGLIVDVTSEQKSISCVVRTWTSDDGSGLVLFGEYTRTPLLVATILHAEWLPSCFRFGVRIRAD